MALVAYGSGSSDEESDEEMEVDKTPLIIPKSSVGVNSGVQLSSSGGSDNKPIVMEKFLKFDILPEPQPDTVAGTSTSIEDIEEGPIPPKKLYGDELEKPPGNDIKISSFANLRAQKVGGVMKISIPSLKDFEEEKDTNEKKTKVLQPSKKGSGLFAILPEPKSSSLFSMTKPGPSSTSTQSEPFSKSSASLSSTSLSSSSAPLSGVEPTPTDSGVSAPSKSRSLLPHVVQQALLGKRPTPTKLDEIKSKYLKQEANVRIVSRGKKSLKNDDSDDSDEDGPNDYFSFAAANEVIPDDPSLRLPDYVPPLPSAAVNHPDYEYSSGTVGEGTSSASYSHSSPMEQEPNPMQFIPQSKKSKSGAEPINFIDVNADDLRPESQEWLRNITAEPPTRSRAKDAPGGLVKRKHQITYLAFEAKEREQSLKAQWSQNRHNKRATQSKYGF